MVNLRVIASKIPILSSRKRRTSRYVPPKFRGVKHAFLHDIDIEAAVNVALEKHKQADREFVRSRIIEISRQYISDRDTYNSIRDKDAKEYIASISIISSRLKGIIDLEHPVGRTLWDRVRRSFKARYPITKVSEDGLTLLNCVLECIETSADALSKEIGEARSGRPRNTHVHYAVLELGKLFEELTGERVTKNIVRSGGTPTAAGTGHEFIIQVLQAIDPEIPEQKITAALEKRPVNP